MEIKDMLQLILTALLSAVAGGWAVWIFWNQKKQKREEELSKREEEKKRQRQLYANPFILAANDLQSRLYNILELSGLSVLRKGQPDGSYAELTLYLVAKYFGWVRCLKQNGLYAEDDKFREFTESIQQSFAINQYELSGFCFFRPDQEALGQHVIKRISGATQAEYDAIPFYEFKEQLASPPLSDIKLLSDTLNALKNARYVEELEGRERLIVVQNMLVDLLNYLEEKEGYSVFSGTRKKASATSK